MTRTAAAIGLLFATLSWAQEGEPILRSSTRLVQVGVIAQDKSGHAVTGLKAEDFRVKDAGKHREIRLFGMNQAGSSGFARRASDGSFTNTGAEQEGPGSVTVIVIDYLNTPWTSQAFATRQLLKYLREINPEDRLAIYTIGSGGLRLLHDYTADCSELVATLAKWKGELADPGVRLSSILLGREDGGREAYIDGSVIDRANGHPLPTLQAFEQLAQILDGIPARKNLIWISGGFGSQEWGNTGVTAINGEAPAIMKAPAWAGHDTGVRVRDSMDGSQSYSLGIDRAMRRFNDANVAVYPIQTRGLSAPVGGLPAKIRDAALDSVQHSMLSIAGATGGAAFVSNNDIYGAIKTAVSSSQVTYTLGFYADAKASHEGFHKIEVALVNHPGVTLRYRKGYEDNVVTAADGTSREKNLDQAGWSPLDANAIPLTATLDQKTGLLVHIGTGSLDLRQQKNRWTGKLDVLLVQRDDRGNEFQRVNDTIFMDLKPETYKNYLTSGIPYQHAIPLNPEASYVRVVVRDTGTGNIGSLTIPLKRTGTAVSH